MIFEDAPVITAGLQQRGTILLDPCESISCWLAMSARKIEPMFISNRHPGYTNENYMVSKPS